jgi:hypothetical protein
MWMGLLVATVVCGGTWGCDRKGGGSGGPPQAGAKPGHLVGKLADAHGRPLSNVTVMVFGFSDRGEPVTREKKVTGPAAEYDIELPEGKYNTPVARIDVDYNGRRYVLPLAAADGTREWLEQRESRGGMVRDFVWRISGPIPGGDPATPAGYYGGTIQFDKGEDLGDIATVEITLTPDGPLIDGNPGQPVTFTRKLPWRRHEDHYLFDVPLGKYTATAKLAFGSTPKAMRVWCYTIDPTRPDEELKTPEQLHAKATVEFIGIEPKPGEFRLLQPNLIVFPPR